MQHPLLCANIRNLSITPNKTHEKITEMQQKPQTPRKEPIFSEALGLLMPGTRPLADVADYLFAASVCCCSDNALWNAFAIKICDLAFLYIS